MHIVDRRLNPGSKSLENRQRFLRRAKALVQRAVGKTSQDRSISDILEGGEVRGRLWLGERIAATCTSTCLARRPPRPMES